MAALHNRVSQKELKERMYQETEPRVTLSFYRYFNLPDPKKFRDDLYKALYEQKVFGRIYVAAEGINAQISLPQSRLEWFRDYCNTLRLEPPEPVEQTLPVSGQMEPSPDGPAYPGPVEPLKDIRLNIAVDDDGKSFWVLKIKVRDKIVADGITDPSFDMGKKGRYVDAETFNRLTENPDTVVVDMRNHYEYEVGHFENAIEVPSDTFRDQLPMSVDMLKDNKEQPIIMYCTGGIRCEKASAWFLHNGFTNVFHLEGGIIHYANTVKEKGLHNKFRGKNFVFDDRLGERINDEIISHCHQCGAPADTHTNCKNEGCHLLFIQCAACAEKYEGCCSEGCLETTHKPAEEQAVIRKNREQAPRVFNKARKRTPPEPTPDR